MTNEQILSKIADHQRAIDELRSKLGPVEAHKNEPLWKINQYNKVQPKKRGRKPKAA